MKPIIDINFIYTLDFTQSEWISNAYNVFVLFFFPLGCPSETTHTYITRATHGE